jgi:hypothetical protein
MREQCSRSSTRLDLRQSYAVNSATWSFTRQNGKQKGFAQKYACIVVLQTNALAGQTIAEDLFWAFVSSRHTRSKPPLADSANHAPRLYPVRTETSGQCSVQVPSWENTSGAHLTQISSDSRFGSAGQSQPEKSLRSWESACDLQGRLCRSGSREAWRVSPRELGSFSRASKTASREMKGGPLAASHLIK